MRSRIMCSGGLVCFTEEDPKIPMGSVIELRGHRFWVYAGEVNRNVESKQDEEIVYSCQSLGSGDVIKLDDVAKR